ncbi:hypothetical protein PR048_017390 [Dryococelus australis]|uniref:Uncharacterized protein n=1 Tax=Dryococelus australis TaxID=614101 RepID=A0ABQ9H9D4_9NEOP|nr:hypothetical protein PR048_017390 [Dryococelus australis]
MYAVCNYFYTRIKRGASKSTTNLMKHNSAQHKFISVVKKPQTHLPTALIFLHNLQPIIIAVLAYQKTKDVPGFSTSITYLANTTAHSPSPVPRKICESSAQTSIKNYIDLKSKFKEGDPGANTIIRLIAGMICIDNQPLSLVENTGFRNLINHLEPRYIIPTRKTISTKIIPAMYQTVKENVVYQL